MRWRWKAGCASRRCRSQKSPSLVSRPVAQHQRVEAQGEVLAEVACLRHQHVLDQLGAADEEDAARPETQRRHVAPVAGAAAEEVQPVAAELRQVAVEPVTPVPQV